MIAPQLVFNSQIDFAEETSSLLCHRHPLILSQGFVL